MNKLDGKVIVDRDLFRALYLLARNSDTGKLREADAATCRELWNQDLTGWAAVPVEETRQMMDAARQYKNLLTPWGRAYRAMLNASPPLGGGE